MGSHHARDFIIDRQISKFVSCDIISLRQRKIKKINQTYLQTFWPVYSLFTSHPLKLLVVYKFTHSV